MLLSKYAIVMNVMLENEVAKDAVGEGSPVITEDKKEETNG